MKPRRRSAPSLQQGQLRRRRPGRKLPRSWRGTRARPAGETRLAAATLPGHSHGTSDGQAPSRCTTAPGSRPEPRASGKIGFSMSDRLSGFPTAVPGPASLGSSGAEPETAAAAAAVSACRVGMSPRRHLQRPRWPPRWPRRWKTLTHLSLGTKFMQSYRHGGQITAY